MNQSDYALQIQFKWAMQTQFRVKGVNENLKEQY